MASTDDTSGPAPGFRALFEAAPGLLLVLSPALTIVAATTAYCDATLTRRGDLVGRDLFQALPERPDEPATRAVANLRASLERVVARRRADRMGIQKYDIRRPSSAGGGTEEHYWTAVNTPVLAADGSVAWIIHGIEDVTEGVRLRGEEAARERLERDHQALKDYERRLQSAKERFEAAVLAVSDIVWTTDRDGMMAGEQPGWTAFTGQPAAQLEGERWIDAVHPEDAEPTRAAWRSGVSLEQPFELDHRLRRHDGAWRPCIVRAIPIREPDGRVREWVGVHRDLTNRNLAVAAVEERNRKLDAESGQRRQAETALRRSQEEFRFLFRNNPLPMWVYDLATLRFLEVNDAAVFGYGYARDELMTMGIADIRPPEDVVRLKQSISDTGPEFEHSANWRHRRKNGQVISVDIWSHAIRFEEHAARLVVAVDVTERNAAEEQLRQAQKMEAVGQLTGGIAHDFNNLLAIIQGNLELVREQVAADRTLEEMIEDALESARRGASLTQQLLAFARRQPLAPRAVALPALVSELSALLRRTLGAPVRIESRMAEDLWRARIDPHQLENALINLAVNARDAMPGGGTLAIEAQNAWLDQHYAEQHVEVTPGPYVLLSVTDTGTGMTREVLERVLEPFFTTKPAGRGSGLGLSMVYGFIKQSGGHIKIYSELGRGTTIKLYLPPAGDAQSDPARTQAGPGLPVAVAGEVILVVEDDAAVRKLAVRLLRSLGYETIEAEDGPSALQILEGSPRVDLFFTDVVLPKGPSGPALARAAQARRPGLKVLYMSGYTRNAILHNGVLDAGVHLLSKPFLKADLAHRVRQLLDDGDPT